MIIQKNVENSNEVMKKVILILSITLLCSCIHTIRDNAKVIKVEYAYNQEYTYKITAKRCDKDSYSGCIEILTNVRYNIGDSICIVKK